MRRLDMYKRYHRKTIVAFVKNMYSTRWSFRPIEPRRIKIILDQHPFVEFPVSVKCYEFG